MQDDPDNDQARWELGVAEGTSGYSARAVRSILMSMRWGLYSADRMFLLTNVMNACGMKKKARYVFEKAICKLFPSLTHIDEGLRSLNALSPHLLTK